MYNKLIRADGVIIATPEHNHTITAALKSTLEWMSFNLHPFENKPVMIMELLTMTKELHVRKCIYVKSWMLQGKRICITRERILIRKSKEAFDEEGNIKSEGTVAFLRSCLENFIEICGGCKSVTQTITNTARRFILHKPNFTTVEGVDPDDPEWVEKASEIVGAAQRKRLCSLRPRFING